MVVISLLWVVVGFSLAFGDSLGGVIGNPMTYFMFDRVGTKVTRTSRRPSRSCCLPCFI